MTGFTQGSHLQIKKCSNVTVLYLYILHEFCTRHSFSDWQYSCNFERKQSRNMCNMYVYLTKIPLFATEKAYEWQLQRQFLSPKEALIYNRFVKLIEPYHWIFFPLFKPRINFRLSQNIQCYLPRPNRKILSLYVSRFRTCAIILCLISFTDAIFCQESYFELDIYSWY